VTSCTTSPKTPSFYITLHYTLHIQCTAKLLLQAPRFYCNKLPRSLACTGDRSCIETLSTCLIKLFFCIQCAWFQMHYKSRLRLTLSKLCHGLLLHCLNRWQRHIQVYPANRHQADIRFVLIGYSAYIRDSCVIKFYVILIHFLLFQRQLPHPLCPYL